MTVDVAKKHDYLLLTRINRGDELIHVGTFKAVNDDLAKIYAQHIYDEEDWVEMFIVKKEALVCVRSPEPLFAKE